MICSKCNIDRKEYLKQEDIIICRMCIKGKNKKRVVLYEKSERSSEY